MAQGVAIYDRQRAALQAIADMPIDAHTCRDHVMREAAQQALGEGK